MDEPNYKHMTGSCMAYDKHSQGQRGLFKILLNGNVLAVRLQGSIHT